MNQFEEFAVSIRNLGEEKVIAASKEAREELKKVRECLFWERVCV